jgi:hypothetical protein
MAIERLAAASTSSIEKVSDRYNTQNVLRSAAPNEKKHFDH